jgi:predicted DNA-binding protein (MmcQ/YjbR family)
MRDLYKLYLKTRSIDLNKLSKFGFKKKANNEYSLIKQIQNGDFSIIINVGKDTATSMVVDMFDDAEYTLVDVTDSSGKFVGSIKEEYENLINEFINRCTYIDTFKEKSSKNIIEYIKNKYDDDVEYLWDDYDGGVFRNKDNKKWYGVMMKIREKSFVTSTLKRLKVSGKVSNHPLLEKKDFSDEQYMEVIDIHIDKANADGLIDYETIFPGFHMNQYSWITIILDNKTNLKKLYELLDASYSMTVKSGSYIVPSNISIFDVISYVEGNDRFVWYKQPKDAKVGDTVFIYVGAPYSQIMYKCEITAVNLKIYSNRDMELKLLKKYKKGEYSYGFLKENGLGFIRTPRSIPEKVAKLLK